MTKSDWQASYCMSSQSVAARAKLRAVANQAAAQADKEPGEVLKVLVQAQARERYAHNPEAIPGAVQFEMGLHDSDELRELTGQALAILEAS